MKLVSTLILALSALATAQKRKKSSIKIETTPKFATAELALKVDKWMQQTDPTANSIYSPVSLYNILASVYFGTGKSSKTRTELQEKFNFKKDFNIRKYSKKLGAMTKHSALDTFNSYIFHKNSVNRDYARDLKSLNFNKKQFKNFVGKENMINGIVEKDTDAQCGKTEKKRVLKQKLVFWVKSSRNFKNSI